MNNTQYMTRGLKRFVILRLIDILFKEKKFPAKGAKKE